MTPIGTGRIFKKIRRRAKISSIKRSLKSTVVSDIATAVGQKQAQKQQLEEFFQQIHLKYGSPEFARIRDVFDDPTGTKTFVLTGVSSALSISKWKNMVFEAQVAKLKAVSRNDLNRMLLLFSAYMRADRFIRKKAERIKKYKLRMPKGAVLKELESDFALPNGYNPNTWAHFVAIIKEAIKRNN